MRKYIRNSGFCSGIFSQIATARSGIFEICSGSTPWPRGFSKCPPATGDLGENFVPKTRFSWINLSFFISGGFFNRRCPKNFSNGRRKTQKKYQQFSWYHRKTRVFGSPTYFSVLPSVQYKLAQTPRTPKVLVPKAPSRTFLYSNAFNFD